jgi:hypothetical protein
MHRVIQLPPPALALAIGITLAASPANAVTLVFNQLVNGTQIENYFDGGMASNGATGPSDGVVFSTNANEQRQGATGNAPSGGTGKFENNPSGLNGVIYFPFSNSTTSYLNYATGFSTLSFGYSLLNNSSTNDDTVEIFSGLNGAGMELASLSLTPNSTVVGCASSPGSSASGPSAKDEFCTWSTASASNFGTAESILFGPTGSSPLQSIEFDDVQLTPLPAALPLFATGLGAMGMFGWRRKRKSAVVDA